MFKQWEIYYTDLEPTIWREQSWKRPVVIVSWDSFNLNLNTVLVMPVTSKIKKYFWALVLEPSEENWLDYKSEILSFHIRSISVNRLINKIWYIKKQELELLLDWLNLILRY